MEHNNAHNHTKNALVWFGIIFMVYVLLVAVGLISSGFKLASGGKEGAEQLFAFATNPFLGLIIGTMATALVQSSSTVTSVIVGLVAGGLPVATAVPMVMGANIGTTITNTLVSLGHARDKEEFKRAFSAATVHDFFNLLSVIVFLPLEMAFGFLEKAGLYLAQLFMGGESLAIGQFNFMKAITKPVVGVVKDVVHDMPTVAAGTIMVVIGITLIFLSITYIGKLLKKVMVGRAKRILHAAIGRGPISGITSGTVVTVLVQSSSTTTSLAVPLAGSGLFTTRDIYPFTLGANIGTCITALLAATAITGGNAVFALQIALVHLLYNVLGVLVIYGIPFLREIPLIGSAKLAHFASEYRAVALVYIVGVFFFIPGMFVFISSAITG